MMQLLEFVLLVLFIVNIYAQERCIPCNFDFIRNEEVINLLKLNWCGPTTQLTDYVIETEVYPCVPCDSFHDFHEFQMVCNQTERTQFGTSEAELPPHIQTCEEFSFQGYNGIMFQGRCQQFLEQGSCPINHWLVYKDQQVRCQKRDCPNDMYTFHFSCVSKQDDLCGLGRFMDITSDGSAECVCNGAVDFPTGNCYHVGEEGPCTPDAKVDRAIDQSLICTPRLCESGFSFSDWGKGPITLGNKKFRLTKGGCDMLGFGGGGGQPGLFNFAVLRSCAAGQQRFGTRCYKKTSVRKRFSRRNPVSQHPIFLPIIK